MTDKELIETLRGRNGFGWTEDAADRIEALVADVAGWISNAQAARNYQLQAEYKLEVAEAKLAKAMTAFHAARDWINEAEWENRQKPQVWMKGRCLALSANYYIAVEELETTMC